MFWTLAADRWWSKWSQTGEQDLKPDVEPVTGGVSENSNALKCAVILKIEYCLQSQSECFCFCSEFSHTLAHWVGQGAQCSLCCFMGLQPVSYCEPALSQSQR